MIKQRLDKHKDIPYEYDKVVFENGDRCRNHTL